MSKFNEPIDLLFIFAILSVAFLYASLKSFEWFSNSYSVISALVSVILLGLAGLCIILTINIADEIRNLDNK